ncbi:MAG: response regulator [Bacteroidota bacterium]|nr:response regulator [Bacteroidota bacterium]
MKKVILIDDDPINNFVNKKLIQRLFDEIEIIEFLDAVSALKYLDNNKPDFIFLDINMPEMNGWDFLKAYEKMTEQSSVIILTTSIDPADRARSEMYPFVEGFFVKPLNIGATQKVISKD